MIFSDQHHFVYLHIPKCAGTTIRTWLTRNGASDVFVFPSLEEGDPLVTYEAALHGLPIVASRMGAGRMGDISGRMCVIDPNDLDNFATTLEHLAQTHTARAQMGQTVRKAVEEYDWNKVARLRAASIEGMFDRHQNIGMEV